MNILDKEYEIIKKEENALIVYKDKCFYIFDKELKKTNNYLYKTDRLVLRRLSYNDLSDFYEYMSNEDVLKYEPYQPLTLKEAKEKLSLMINSNEFLGVELLKNHKLIGHIYVDKELSYVFNKEYWRNGYAKESITKVIKEGLYAKCKPENVKSIELLKSLGFIYARQERDEAIGLVYIFEYHNGLKYQ